MQLEITRNAEYLTEFEELCEEQKGQLQSYERKVINYFVSPNS